MGNCLRLRISSIDDDDYDDGGWDSSVATDKLIPEKQGLLTTDRDSSDGAFSSSLSSSSSSNSVNKIGVKIKISKEQLEKVIGEVNMHDMPVDQVLLRLINAGDQQYSGEVQHQRSWRPHLQSIPEID